MIFADKLIQLRKRSGWSQEELAEQMNVTRQSVSKWEGAQSIPDLSKIVRLSELFEVSTDYLLKDDIEEIEVADKISEEKKDSTLLRKVSMEEANAFLKAKLVTAKTISYAVLLCILSPVCLLFLGAMSEVPKYHLSENVAGGVGMIILLVLVAIAVAIFITSGSKTSSFLYLEEEPFETEYGVTGMVRERKEEYKNTYTRNNMIGVCLCILSLIPLFSGVIINENNDLFLVCMLLIMFVLVGIGVVFFIQSGIIWASFEKLLQEGDYSKRKKEKHPVMSAVATVYWLTATAIYLAYSFMTDNWQYSWIVWVIAGVMYPAIVAIVHLFVKKK